MFLTWLNLKTVGVAIMQYFLFTIVCRLHTEMHSTIYYLVFYLTTFSRNYIWNITKRRALDLLVLFFASILITSSFNRFLPGCLYWKGGLAYRMHLHLIIEGFRNWWKKNRQLTRILYLFDSPHRPEIRKQFRCCCNHFRVVNWFHR